MPTEAGDNLDVMLCDVLKQPPELRTAEVVRVTGSNPALRERLEKLLRTHREAGDFLDKPAVTVPEELRTPEPLERPGTIIDRYKLLELIGQGGFGAVYMAQQSEPVRRKVALKIIKLGMDTKQVIARFEAERQALAMMDHPNIAKVLDAGATETGRPYFVMELVKGVPITEYCDTENLATKDRLDLMTRVCNAVQHAHQKGVIHRDIKPSNVMVTIADGRPIPKVIDFGIAKATDRALTDKTLFTEFRQLIGTPAYMSPEQAEMSGVDIDTRSDIYSLGVLLYELLTGTTPFDPERLRSAAFGEMQRIIREEEPDKPSTRVASDLRVRRSSESHPPGSGRSEPQAQAPGSSSPRKKPIASSQGSSAFSSLVSRSPFPDPSSAITIAKHRRSDPRSLARHLRGDLDWIVMKCLEKDRTRRYETANGIASDIQRHLENQPVQAGPPTAAYRFRKFARRNKRLLGSVTGIAAALIIGLTLATYGFITASTALDQEKRARAEAEAVTDFLSDMLAVVPGKPGKDVTVREVLDEASEKIAEKFADRPLIEARLRATIGWSYYRLGLYSEAEPHSVRALDIRQRLLGEEHPETLSTMNNLAILYDNQGRYDEAEPLFLDTLEIRRRLLGEEHPDTLSSTNNLALVYLERGRYDEAEALHLDTLEIKKRILGEEHPGTLLSMNNLAILYKVQGRYDEAEALHLDTLEIRKRILGEEHPDTLASMNNLATLYHRQGRYDEAEPLYAKALEMQTHVLGEEHPDTLASMNGLAILYWRKGRYDDAKQLYLATLEIMKRILGEEHLVTLASMNNLALVYKAQGRYDEAEPLFLDALEIKKRILGKEHPDTLLSMNNLAVLYQDKGRYDEAESLYLDTLEIRQRILGKEHPETLTSMSDLANFYAQQGRYDDAEAVQLDTLEIRQRILGDEHPDTLTSMNNLANVYRFQGRYNEAEGLHLRALAGSRRALGDDHPQTNRVRSNLIEFYKGQARAEEARPLISEHLAILREAAGRPAADAGTLNQAAWGLLTVDPTDQRDPQAALDLALQANDLTKHENPLYLDTLALAYHLTGDTGRALETQQEALSLLTEDQESYRPEMEANLAKYKAVLERGAEDD